MQSLKIANKDGYRWGEDAYLVGLIGPNHEFDTICVSYGNNEQEALDNAVDEGFMNSELMSADDYCEYERNGWYDRYIIAGNASEAFYSECLWVKPASGRKAA